jgi:hypothetical protein
LAADPRIVAESRIDFADVKMSIFTEAREGLQAKESLRDPGLTKTARR